MLSYENFKSSIASSMGAKIRGMYLTYKSMKLGYNKKSSWFADPNTEKQMEKICAVYDTEGYKKTVEEFKAEESVKQLWDSFVQDSDHTKYLYELYIAKTWKESLSEKLKKPN